MIDTQKTSARLIHETVNDPCASYWLKTALRESIRRDPVDAVADAEYLYRILAKRCAEVLSPAKEIA